MSESVRDLSLAIYMGTSLDEKYHNSDRARRNKELLSVTQRAMLQMFEETEPEVKLMEYIDHYGRVTFYSVLIGGAQIPVYQPGTILFEAAVEAESDLANFEDGEQMNGKSLCLRAALFLQKFVVSLSKCYTILGGDSKTLNASVLKNALES